jgi:multidrug resistance efflux pump
MGSTHSPRRFAILRTSLAVWLGIVLLLGSLVVTAVNMRTHASDTSSAAKNHAGADADERRWAALGFADVEGGVTPLYPVQLGRVQSITAQEGELVEAGTPLFHMDDQIAKLKVKEAETALAQANDTLTQAQEMVVQHQKKVAAQKQAIEIARLDADLARFQRDKAKRLENVAGDPETLPSAETMLKKAEAAVKAEQDKLAVLEAMKPQLAVDQANNDVKHKTILLDEAKRGLEECTVKAPCKGTPLRILVSVGQTLGSNPSQPAVQFCPDRPLVVRAEVEQEFAGRVQSNQPTNIKDHVTGDICGAGWVQSISRWYTHRRSILQDPLQFNDVRTLECVIKLDPAKSSSLRIGQRVRVEFLDR